MGCPWSQSKPQGEPVTALDVANNGSACGRAPLGENAPHYLKADADVPKDFQKIQIDPRIPMNNQQAFKLLQSWRGIKRNMGMAGVEMFVSLFRTNSELQAMFKGFKDIKSDSELRSNEALENHATLVMSTLDDAITHIDNYDYVKELLFRTSVTHTKFSGFQPAYFMLIKEPFLEAVRVTLGDRYTDNMQNIYTIAITYVLQTLKDGMEEALKK